MKVSLYAKFENVIRAVIGDAITRALVYLDFYHHETHEGRAYNYSGRVTLPAGGIYEFLVVTPNTTRWLHLEDFYIHSDGSIQVDFYKDSSKADVVGNRITVQNRNLNSSNTTVATVCHTPSGSGDGTAIFSRSADADHPVTGASEIRGSRKEWILKQNSAHLLRLTGAENDVVDFDFDWYEHQPD